MKELLVIGLLLEILFGFVAICFIQGANPPQRNSVPYNLEKSGITIKLLEEFDV